MEATVLRDEGRGRAPEHGARVTGSGGAILDAGLSAA